MFTANELFDEKLTNCHIKVHLDVLYDLIFQSLAEVYVSIDYSIHPFTKTVLFLLKCKPFHLYFKLKLFYPVFKHGAMYKNPNTSLSRDLS